MRRVVSFVPLAVVVAAAVGGCAGADVGVVEDGPLRRLHVSGHVVTSAEGRPARGVYGLRVRLLLRRADGSGWEAPGAPGRHRAFDVLGEDGAFRFEIATALDPARFDSVAVVPTSATEAVSIVPHPPGARRLGDDVLLWTDAARAALPPSGVVENVRHRLRPEVGVVVRTATLARAFVVARYGGDVPFSLPPVRVELSRRGGFVFQALDPDVLGLGGHEIELNAARTITPTTVAHEYGHYVSFQMWGANPLRYTLRNRSLREGWAIFFSFAARAWAAATTGDADLASSNPERAPFTDRFEGARRYLGISYGQSRPEYAAIGALLWSLYDVAEPSPFEWEGPSAGSLAGDNDDLAFGLAVFEAVRLTRTSVLDEAGIVEVVRALRQRAPEQAASIDGAVAFFLCSAAPACDVAAPSDGTPSTSAPTLRPVAPGRLAARRLADGAVGLRWAPRTYAAPWANLPEAYRVYRDGALVATLPPDATAWTDRGAGSGDVRYEVRAVGGGGESSGSPTVRVGAHPARSR